MKRMKQFIIVLIILFLFLNIVYANSGPTYWEGYPTFEILSVQENNSIVVEKEDLVFDFSKDEYLEYGDYSLSGLVTATYKMYNQSNKDETIQMAFPLITSLDSFNPELVTIKVNNQDIPFDIYIGDKPIEDNLDFNSILSSISRDTYKPKNYNLDTIGTLYSYAVSKTSEDTEHFQLTFNHDQEKTKIVCKGINSYGWSYDVAHVAARIYDKEMIEFFVLGEDINPSISQGNFTYEENIEKLSIRDYLTRVIENFEEAPRYNAFLSHTQLFNLFSMELDEVFGNNVSMLTLEDFYFLDHRERFIVFIYNVNFPRESRRDVSVSYLASGTMDRRDTIDPLHTYEYLLNPAKNWADFRNLNIEIKPPVKYSFIIESSIDLIRNENGNYIGQFDSLPDKDLSFTLYSKEEITLIDKIKKDAYDFTRYFPIEYALGLLIIIGGYIIKRILKNKKT